MRRVVGLVPVSLLTLAVVLGTVVGLSLSTRLAARSMADELGCDHPRSSHPQAGVTKVTCSYHGDTLVILSLTKGPHALYPPDVPDTLILAPPHARNLVIGCQRRTDCVTIQRDLGGDLSSGPMIGLSLVIG